MWSTQVAGGLTPAAAELTGLPADVPVIAGTIDAASEALGAGVERTGDMMMMYGSSNYFDSVDEVDRWVNMEEEIVPNEAAKAVYDEGYARYRDLYDSTRHLLG